MRPVRRALAAVFAGDRRVWRAAALFALPAVLLGGYYCLKPRPYFTGTDSVEAFSFAPVPAQAQLCVPGLDLPAGTAFVRLKLKSLQDGRPALALVLSSAAGVVRSALPAQPLRAGSPSNADFPIPLTPARPSAEPGSLCVRAAAPVTWGVTYLSKPGEQPPRLDGARLAAGVAVWFLPRAGAQRSYLSAAGQIFTRAALFRPGLVGAWTYPVLLFVLLPALALAAVRLLAMAVAGRRWRLGRSVYAIAALNACCWALITPVFQGPDEVDHFAYAQSLVERGVGPSHDPASRLPRWSGAENRALEASGFFTDHQTGESRPAWLPAQQRRYQQEAALLTGGARADGGGYTTSAAHGPLYYLALAPAYAVTRGGSVFSQLTLMRLLSALLGALAALCAFLIVRELVPGRPWLAVLAGALVAFEPMYGFISGTVNNDVGVNALAAGVELLTLRTLRRGLAPRRAALLGVMLLALPFVKGTGLSLYPVVILALLGALWRQHSREDARAWLAFLAGAGLALAVAALALPSLQPAASATGTSAVSSNASAASGALHHIPDYLAYVWQVFLPRLPFMTRHFDVGAYPAYEIFIRRGWGAFGWYTVFFPEWVYRVISLAVIGFGALAACAAVRRRAWLREHWLEALTLIAFPVAVVLGFEAAYYQHALRYRLPEFGRYAFTAVAPLAAIVFGALHALRGRLLLYAAVALLVATISLSYASQLLTLTGFYA